MFYRADFEIGLVFGEELLPVNQTLQERHLKYQLSGNVAS